MSEIPSNHYTQLQTEKELYVSAFNNLLANYGISFDALETNSASPIVQIKAPDYNRLPQNIKAILRSNFRGIPIRVASIMFHYQGAMVAVEPTEEEGYKHRSGYLVSPLTELVTHPAIEFHLENMTRIVTKEPYAIHEQAMDPMGSNMRMLYSESEWKRSVQSLRPRLIAELTDILETPKSLYSDLNPTNIAVIVTKIGF